MQQAPNYPEQEQIRRETLPQQSRYQAPMPANLGAGPADLSPAAERQGGALAWSDWVRWGPIWGGFFTILSTLAVLGALGTAISLTIWGPTTSTAFDYAWAIFSGVVAYFLGGWVTARAAGVRGLGAAVLNSALAWALSLVAILALVLIGAGNVISVIGGNLYLLLRVSASGVTRADIASTLAQTAWITFVSLVIGLILAVCGGIVGMRSFPMRRARTL